jgi:MmeI, target recognition domain
MTILKEKVWPERRSKPGSYSKQWWLFGRRNQEGQRVMQKLDRVLVAARHQPQWTITFLKTGAVFSDALNIFAFPENAAFAILQSRLHEVWARFFGSSMKDDLRYNSTDCFETFPFAPKWQLDKTLDQIGEEYYNYRADLMVRTGNGLTEIYNRFHDRSETDSDILKLRELHTTMDRAVLDAYGWTDLNPQLDFILDYEEEDDVPSASRERKKPWRYRWIDQDRDEVIARLLEMNRIRAEEGVQSSAASPTTKRVGKRSRKPTKNAPIPDQAAMNYPESTE